jgi:phospholipid/cholesterol/gamma-HCH transport system permease protein
MRSLEAYATEVGGATTLRLRGPFRVEDAPAIRDELRRATRAIERGKVARFDLSSVAEADGAASAVLMQVQLELRARGVRSELVGANPDIAELLGVYSGRTHGAGGRWSSAKEALSRVGCGGIHLLRDLQGWLAFFGATVLAAARLARRPRAQNWRALLPLMERAGAGAAPIVLLINALIGIVAAYEYDLATRPLGAAVYAPGFAGLSIARELGPLMTAIVVAGKTGAAFTAELGTMKVSREIDALRSLDLDPIGFLVLPRMAALVLTLPLLTLMADGAGMIGGLVVTMIKLDASPQEYFRQVQDALSASDIIFGLQKSAAFGLAIAFVACRQGLAVAGSVASIGRRTAAAMASILFATVLIDALFPRGS